MKTWILLALVAVVFVALLAEIYRWRSSSPDGQQPSPHAIDQSSGG